MLSRLRHFLTRRRALLAAGVLAAAVLLLVLAGGGRRAEPPRAAFRYPVQAVQVQRGAARPEIEVSGRIEAGRKQTLIAYFDAWVDEVRVVAGQEVKAGAPLLSLGKRFIADALHEARLAADSTAVEIAKLDEREAYLATRLGIEEDMLKRLQLVKDNAAQLRTRGVITVMDYETHLSSVDMRRLQVLELQREKKNLPLERRRLRNDAEKLRGQIARLDSDLQQAELIAPFDAVVLEVAAEPGGRVATGTKLVSLAPLDGLQVSVPWPVDHRATAQVAAYAVSGGQQIALRVAEIGSVIEAGRSTPHAVLSAEGRLPAALALGSFVPVRLQLPPIADAFVIPESSLYAGERVFRLDKADSVLDGVRVQVDGQRYARDGSIEWIVSAAELADGDRLLTTRLAAAAEGLPVLATTHASLEAVRLQAGQASVKP
jgi:multidrug efflux pump subunit AcrA (membrane-fusion protein)